MKKIYLLILIFTILFSCSNDDNANRFYYEVLKIGSYTVPTEFTSGETYSITVTYKRPTTCHYFNNLYYYREESIRKIGIESIVEERDNCTTIENSPLIEYKFDFQVIQAVGTSYTFKFYKGKDANGASIFEDVVIPVTN